MRSALKGTVDSYNCLHVLLESVPQNFSAMLEESLKEWEQQHKAVWVQVPNSALEGVKICADLGFYPHHANDLGVMMAKWLLESPNTLPSYSSHYVGAGGLVFRGDNEILVVKNNTSPVGVINWRIPGGLVETTETVLEAAARETKEETGIETSPIGVVAFREKPPFVFNRPDIYFIVLLEALSFEVTPDYREVLEARWMDFKEWIAEDTSNTSRYMLEKVFNNSSESPKQVFTNKVMLAEEFCFKTPKHQSTHLCHLAKP